MRYDDAATRQALAAEYVLGTLRGPARRRFERLMAQRADWREEVERWSHQLAGFAASVPEVEPPPDGLVAYPGSNRAGAVPIAAGRAALVEGACGDDKPCRHRARRSRSSPSSSPPSSLRRSRFSKTSRRAPGGWCASLRASRAAPRFACSSKAQRRYPTACSSSGRFRARARAPVSLGLLPAQGEAVLPRVGAGPTAARAGRCARREPGAARRLADRTADRGRCSIKAN